MKIVFVFSILLSVLCGAYSDETTASEITEGTIDTTITTTTTTSVANTTTLLTTTEKPDGCNNKTGNITCDTCIENSDCLFCKETNKCIKLVFDGLYPTGCPLSKARWSVCFLDLQALIISVSVIGTVILIVIFSAICYCCNATCRTVTNHRIGRVERKLRKEKNQRDVERNERRGEREKKYDDIRVKYGLKKDDKEQATINK